MAVEAHDLALGQSLRRPLAAGSLTWLAAAFVGAASVSAALASGDGRLFWAAAACTLTATVFALRPDVGLIFVILARPVLDVWADRAIATPAEVRVNIASLMAVTLILVGGSYVVERWSILRDSPAIAPFLVFAAIAAVGLAVAPSDTGAVYEWLRLLSLVVLYGVCYVVVCVLGSARRLALALLASAAVPIGVAVYQTAEGGARVIADFARATGTFLHPVPFGIFLGLLISFGTPLLFSRALPWAFWLGTPVAFVALVGTYTRTAWIGALVGLLLVAVKRHRSLLVLAPLTVVVIAFVVPSTVTRSTEVKTTPGTWGDSRSSVTSRVTQWKRDYPLIKRNPVVGQGLRAIEDTQGEQVHSDYLRAAVETGVFGLAAYLWLLFATVRGSYRSMRRAERAGDRFASAVALGSLAAALAFLVMSATSNLMTQVVVATAFWCIAAVGHAASPSGIWDKR